MDEALRFWLDERFSRLSDQIDAIKDDLSDRDKAITALDDRVTRLEVLEANEVGRRAVRNTLGATLMAMIAVVAGVLGNWWSGGGNIHH